MLLAELEVYHSRPIAPTRRVALGDLNLPVDPAPGYGGVLLGGVAARFAREVDPDLLPDLLALTHEVEAGRRIPQPRLRHRFQQDRIGLTRSTHRLFRVDDTIRFSFTDSEASAPQHLLAAIYAATTVPSHLRGSILATVRRGLAFTGEIGPDLAAALQAGGDAFSLDLVADPVGWAVDVLGFASDEPRPDRSDVQQRFREALRSAHPDHGGDQDDAAQRIADITTARRILLAS